MIEEAERREKGGFEAGKECFGVGCRVDGGPEEAQQDEGDEGDVDLRFDGIFVAAKEAFDLEVLLDPLEQQFDLPALFIESGHFAGRAGEVVGDEDERRFALPCDPDFAQIRGIEGISGSSARSLVADPEAVVGKDALFERAIAGDNIAPHGIGLEPRDEKGTGLVDLLPPAKIEIALIVDIGGAAGDGNRARRLDIADLGG